LASYVIYDLDGTLIDSASVVHKILNHRRAQLNKPPLERHTLLPWLSLGGEELIAAALELNAAQVDDELHNFRAEYAVSPTPFDSVYPGVRETLMQLVQAGVGLAICTNKPRHLARKVLQETQLQDYFAFVSAGGDLPMKKPHPQNLQVCLEFFGAKPSEILYVGDSTVDQQLCQALGVPFVHFLAGYNDGINSNQVCYKITNHLEIMRLVHSPL
jgi:phosphoglycolate phosphatase